jgi:hypothetical protein
MARTRHRSTAVQSYKRPSDELLKKVTNVLQTPKSPIASGVEVESNEVVAKKKCVNKEQRKECYNYNENAGVLTL